MIKRAGAYIRVSTDEQAKKGLSLDAQESKISAFAESQEWKIEGVYSDPGFSGKDLKRPGLQRMIEDIKNKRIDLVLVYKVDRLSRKQKDLWHLLEDVFEPYKVGFKSVIEPFETTTAQGKAFLGMLSVFAQLERDQTRERIKDALAHKKTRKEWVGRPPYGFGILTRDDGNGNLTRDKILTGNPDEAEIVKGIFQARARGKTLAAITEGIKSQEINSRQWSPPVVNGILHNPVYLGNGIVSKGLFNKAQRVGKENGRRWKAIPFFSSNT